MIKQTNPRRLKIIMRLKRFEVASYRSIKKAKIENLQNYCVITGPNNAGKSNLLKAMHVALSIVTEGSIHHLKKQNSFSYIYGGNEYQWDQDIPVDQKTSDSAKTTFELYFCFSDEEKAEFQGKFKVALASDLHMRFVISKKSIDGNIVIQGRAKKMLEQNMKGICEFIQQKLAFEYIPCVRSSDFTAEYFSSLINKELEQLEKDPVYRQHQEEMLKLQIPLIKNLEQKITSSLKTFLPQVASVKIDETPSIVDRFARRSFLRYRHIPISIDDGALTSIENKGDGIKSLAAISIIQSMTFEKAEGRALILLIEEPEAHLHPNAVHSLRNILRELPSSIGAQVFISTHSPILLDRDSVSNNIIVYEDHRVETCSTIDAIREALGVRTIDAMLPEKVIIVEGETDKRIFESLCKQNELLKSRLENQSVVFKAAGSASKIDNLIRYYDTLMISSFALFDSDDSGINACKQIQDSKLKTSKEVALIKSVGKAKSEIEDWIRFDEYFDLVRREYGIELNKSVFKSKKAPWSDCLKKQAMAFGVVWSENESSS